MTDAEAYDAFCGFDDDLRPACDERVCNARAEDECECESERDDHE